MAIKMREIKNMKPEELEKKLGEFNMERISGENRSTKINSIKLSVARIKTYLSQLGKKLAQTPKHDGKRPVVAKPKVVGEAAGKPLNKAKKTIQP